MRMTPVYLIYFLCLFTIQKQLLFNIRKMFLLLLFNIAFLKLSQCYEIKATGNGIIKPGTDLELSLVVNKVWDRHSV